jgi:hypothetical protein
MVKTPPASVTLEPGASDHAVFVLSLKSSRSFAWAVVKAARESNAAPAIDADFERVNMFHRSGFSYLYMEGPFIWRVKLKKQNSVNTVQKAMETR